MNAVAEAMKPGTDIVAVVEATPSLVLVDRQKFSEFYDAMKAECDAHEPDLSTERGRKEIASLAYKVARTKTAIDDAGKKLNEEARARINAIDESRREIRQQLDTLKEEVRRPLTEWEAAEDARLERARGELTRIRDMGRVDFSDTTETIKSRLDQLEALELDPAVHAAGIAMASAARDESLASLRSASERLAREEQERAELERLRAEAAERERVEQERIAAEEEKRQREAEARAEEERKAKAIAEENARIEAAARAAEETARAEAERKAREEREAAERAHADALAAERRRAEEAERAAQAERDRIAKEEDARRAEAEREKAAQAAREADRAHRSKVMGAAKEAVMESGPVDEAAARAIILAIAAGNVPAVSIRF